VLGSGHHAWPRLFFFAIGFAALIVVAGAVAVGDALASVVTQERLRDVARVLPSCALLVAAALGLPRAYGPKQDHEGAIALVEREMRPGDAVVTVGPSIVQEYEHRDWPRVEDAQELAAVQAQAARTWLVHSFPVSFAALHGDIARVLERDFTLVGRFPGTLSGGDVLVWRADRPPSSPADRPDVGGSGKVEGREDEP
jgi:hypothetical protein